MSAKTDFLENELINHVLRNVPYTSPTQVFVGLFQVTPDDTGGGTEVPTGGTAYIRQTITFDPPSNGTTQNNTDVTFPVATASWGTVVAFALFDAVSGGNMLYYGLLTAPKTISTNDVFEWLTGNLTVQEL